MGNEVRHYFGAYLKIEVIEQERQSWYRICENKHTSEPGVFCSKCGKVVKVESETVKYYPHDITQLIGDEWIDVLAHITPQSLYSSGTIIAVGNSGGKRGEWLFVDRWSVSDQENESIEIKPFPTQTEVDAMKSELSTNYESIINALKSCAMVSSVEVCAGYVMDAEY